MATRILHEAGTLASPPAGAETYPILIIDEGRGSSGTYTRALLEGYGHAFDNKPSFMNHPLDPEKPHLRDVTGIAGRIVKGSIEVKEVDGKVGVYAQYRPDPRWREFMQENHDIVGLSIYITGTGREEGGEYIVESFDENDPYASVDVVVAAGRGGRFERAIESARAIETSAGQPAGNGSATAAADEQRKRQNMDEATKAFIEALFSKVDEKFVALESKVDSVISLSESATAAETAQVEALEVADKLAEAKLTESGRKRVLEGVKSGASIEDAIKSENILRDEILAEAGTAGTGRVTESATDEDWGVSL